MLLKNKDYILSRNQVTHVDIRRKSKDVVRLLRNMVRIIETVYKTNDFYKTVLAAGFKYDTISSAVIMERLDKRNGVRSIKPISGDHVPQISRITIRFEFEE